MNRALLSNGRNFNAAHRLTLESDIGGDTSTWINNITSTVTQAGLILNKGGPDNQKLTMDTHIYEIPAWQPIANQLARLGICTLADIQGPTGQLTTKLKDHLPQFPPLSLTARHRKNHLASKSILDALWTDRTRRSFRNCEAL